MTITGDGVRVEPEALRSYAAAARDAAGRTDAAAQALGALGPPAGLGPAADEAGLTAALADRTTAQTAALGTLTSALRGTADNVAGAADRYEQVDAANRARLQGAGAGT